MIVGTTSASESRIASSSRRASDVLVVLLDIRRKVSAGDGKDVRSRDHVVLARRLVEDGVDDRLRAFGVVHRDDPREDGLEGFHLDHGDRDQVPALRPRVTKPLERALDEMPQRSDAETFLFSHRSRTRLRPPSRANKPEQFLTGLISLGVV